MVRMLHAEIAGWLRRKYGQRGMAPDLFAELHASVEMIKPMQQGLRLGSRRWMQGHGGIMQVCIRCKSDRLLEIDAKTSDQCTILVGGHKHYGYVPSDIGLGRGGDYLSMQYCMDCGQIQGDFPLPPAEAEGEEDEEDEDDDFEDA